MANLLDEASIILTPTAYDNGKVLCVKPSAAPYGDFDFSRNSSATRVNAQGLVEDVQILSGNLVTNGDFSQEGAELLTQPVNLVTDFTTNSGGVIVDANTFTTSGGSVDGIKKTFLTVGKSYKLVIEGNTTSSGFTIGDLTLSGVEYGSGFGTHYFVATSTRLWIRQNTSGTTNITSFSVKEVGQDWTLGTGWSIGDDVANCDGTQTGNTNLAQGGVFSTLANKDIKISFTVSNYSVGSVRFISGNGALTHPSVSANGIVDLYFNVGANSGTSFNIQGDLNFVGSVTNISVIEITSDTNLPRINYDGFSYDGSGAIIPNSGCGSWLFEPQSTNLITYSEDLSDASWTKIATTVSSNLTTSPSGGINASTIVSTNATSEQYLDVGGLSVTSGDSYTLCCFVKKKDYDYFLIRFTGVGGAFVASNAFFDINNGTLGTVDSGLVGSITDYGNGWYRCSATIVASATTVSGKVRLQLASSDNSEAIVGDGTSGTFVWGAQFEQQSYATSYIPTEGTTVTRNQDLCTNGGSLATINSTEGVLYAEIAALSNDATRRDITISDGTTSNRVMLRYDNASNRIQGFIQVGGSTNGNMNTTSFTITNFLKIAYKWKAGDFALWINGTEVATSTDATSFAPDVLTEVNFDRGESNGEFYFGKTKCLAVFPLLTDAELTSLTTI